ncbi:MFS general substrate transporter [Mytilinidion resinicola]|uniref:MFS general substrate transporter n=1 Tax=Mytilinidion resinicola TaxID=574789 RepID=A0A6A6Y898_9PEZI|nr:MFS general substrate transporter [Mytilinidion resinicola]KAF2804778.1 MFS general substrate transporter [Mytilinidion resinicola]
MANTMTDTMADENGHESIEDIKSTSIDKEGSQEETAVFELAGSKLLLVMIGLALAIFLSSIDGSIISTAIPRITSQFGSIDDIGWYGSAYSLAMCSFQPIAGKLYANFSMKIVFLSTMAVFEFGSLICATAVNSPMLVVGRAKRGTFIGILHSTYGVATILGPLLGGVLTQHASWRWCFYINLPIGAVTFTFLTLFFHPPARNSDNVTVLQKLAKLDLIGAFLFIPSIIIILLALQWGGTRHAWKSVTIIGLILGGAGLLTVFASWQVHKGDNAMIPPRLITQRTIFTACFINFFAMGAVYTSIYYLPEWFQVIKGVSPTKSGVMYLPLAISEIISAIGAGMGVSFLGYANPFIFTGTALMSIGTGLITTFTPTTSHQRWIPYQVLQGLGAGMTLSMPYMATQTVLKGDDIPVGTSLVQLFQFLGGSVFLSISQALFTNQLTSSLSKLGSVGIGRAEIDKILSAGTSSVRKIVTEAQLSAVIGAYNHGIVSAFYIATAAAAVAFVFTFGLEWRSVKPKS